MREKNVRSTRRPWGGVTQQQRDASARATAAKTARQLAQRLVRKRQRSVKLQDVSDAELFFRATHEQSDDDLDDEPCQNSSEPAVPSTSGSGSTSRSGSRPKPCDKYRAQMKQTVIDRVAARPSLQQHFEESVPWMIQEQLTQQQHRQSSLRRRVTAYTAKPFHSCKEGAWSCGNVLFVKHRSVNYEGLEVAFPVVLDQLHCQTCNLHFETPPTVLR